MILLGEFGVGKTSIFRRYSQGTYVDTSDMDWNEYREATLGLDNFCKTFDCITDSGESRKINVRLYDTGGLERIGSISNSYYKSSEAALLVFARDSLESFSYLTQHLLEVLSFAENAKLYLVSNKVDVDDCEVTDEDVKTFMDHFPTIEHYYQVSAKTNQPSVDEMFNQIAQCIANTVTNKLSHRFDSIKLSAPRNNSYNFSQQQSGQDSNGPSYEHQYERNADVFQSPSSCSCRSM